MPEVAAVREVVVTLTPTAAMLSDSAFVVVAERLSVTRTVKLEVPEPAGVPLIVPLLDRLNPLGSIVPPAMAQV